MLKYIASIFALLSCVTYASSNIPTQILLTNLSSHNIIINTAPETSYCFFSKDIVDRPKAYILPVNRNPHIDAGNVVKVYRDYKLQRFADGTTIDACGDRKGHATIYFYQISRGSIPAIKAIDISLDHNGKYSLSPVSYQNEVEIFDIQVKKISSTAVRLIFKDSK